VKYTNISFSEVPDSNQVTENGMETIKGIQWVEIPLSLVFDDRVFGYWFPPYKKYIPHRLRVLRLALKDLERIKEEYGKD
jgi:hypothetical protein